MRRGWRGRGRLVLAAVLVVSLAAGVGCARAGPGVSGDDPRIVIHDLEGGMDALLTGTLWYDPESRCLFVRHRPTGEVELAGLLWPPGTRPVIHDDGRRGVDAPGRGLILDGDRVEFGGGFVFRPFGFEVPEDCVPETDPGSTAMFAITQLDN